MQFVVIAYDYPDVMERRLASRDAHIALGDQLRDQLRTCFRGGLFLPDNC